MQLIDSWYAEFRDPSKNSDKFYLLTLYSDPADAMAPAKLYTQFGRNGSSGREDLRYGSTDLNHARNEFAKVKHEKSRKGYQQANIPASFQRAINKRTGVTPATNTSASAPRQLMPPLAVPASGFAKMLADRSYIIQTRPPQDGTPAAIAIDSRAPARLLADPSGKASLGATWARELRLEQLRGFAGVSPLLVEGLVVIVNDVAHFVPLDLLTYGGDDVSGYDFGSRWALLNQAIAELRGNGIGNALERWIMPQAVDLASLGGTGNARVNAGLMLRHASAPHGEESPLVQAA